MSTTETNPPPISAPTAEKRSYWKKVYETDSTGLIDLVLDSNGISFSQFVDGAAQTTTYLELFLLRIPSGIPILHHFASSLKTLKMMNIGLQKICHLGSLKNLEVLWLCENDITRIEGLSGLPKLRELYLHFNSIEHIGDGFTSSSTLADTLEVLWLNENKLAGSLKGVDHLKKLRVLNLGNNKIQSLENTSTTDQEISSSSSALPPNLEELVIAGNSLERFGHLKPVLKLEKLKKLVLNDPTYGDNPVCRLSNLHTFLIFHSKNLESLDGIPIVTQQRISAKTTYLQKYAFYAMRARTLRNHMRYIVRNEIQDGLLKHRVAQLHSGTIGIKKLLYALREVDCFSQLLLTSTANNSNDNDEPSTPTNASASSSTMSTPIKTPPIVVASSSVSSSSASTLISTTHTPSLVNLVDQLVSKLRDTLQLCDKLGTLAEEAEDSMNQVVDEVVGRFLSELHSGGNIRYEDQLFVPSSNLICASAPVVYENLTKESIIISSSSSQQQQDENENKDDQQQRPSSSNNNIIINGSESFVWYRSCVDLFRSRMFLPEFSSKGILDLTVTRVTKVHNRALRTRFDTSLSELVDVSDPSFKRGIEYLFLVIPDEVNDSSSSLSGSTDGNNHLQDPYTHFVEEGMSSSSSSSSSSPVTLTNSIYLHEARKISKCSFGQQNMKGRVVLCKVFLGRSFPEAPELSMNYSDSELSNKAPRIDGKKVLPQDTHAVMRCKKLPASSIMSETSSSSTVSAAAANRQRVWFLYKPELVLPEYIIQFDYKVSTQSTPSSDLSSLPWFSPSSSSSSSSAESSTQQQQQKLSKSFITQQRDETITKISDEFLSSVKKHDLTNPTKRADLDAMLQRATAACLSSPVSIQNNGTDLLMLTPSLIWFAQKSAELVSQGLRACSEVHAHVADKVDQLKKTNPVLFECINEKMTTAEKLLIGSCAATVASTQQQSNDQDSSSTISPPSPTKTIATSKNITRFIHLFDDRDSDEEINLDSSSSSSSKTSFANHLLMRLTQPNWRDNITVLVLPHAKLGPKLSSEFYKHELVNLTELDLSSNELTEYSASSFCEEEGNTRSESNNNSCINAPNLIRLNLSENRLSDPNNLNHSVCRLYPKLEHILIFGNEFSSSSSSSSKSVVDDFIIATAEKSYQLETVDGVKIGDRLTDLRSLPEDVSSCLPLIEEKPKEWFDVNFVENDEDSNNDGENEESGENNTSKNKNNTSSTTLIFAAELQPIKFNRKKRASTLVEHKYQSALNIAQKGIQKQQQQRTTANTGDNFNKLESIATLNLTALRIKNVDKIDTFFTRLQKLDLSSNNLCGSIFDFRHSQDSSSSSYHQPVLPSLVYLSVANNFITSMRGLDFLAPNLKSLDIQGNSLTSLFGLPPSVQVLCAECNKIASLVDILPMKSTSGSTSSSSSSLKPLIFSNITELYLAQNDFATCRDVILPIKEVVYNNNSNVTSPTTATTTSSSSSSSTSSPSLFILDLSRNPFKDGELDAMHFALCHLSKIKVYNGIPVEPHHLATAREVYAGKLTEELLLGKIGSQSVWPKVREANFANQALREIDLLSNFVSLRHLILETNVIVSIAPLSRCGYLQTLDLSFNRPVGGQANNPSTTMNLGHHLNAASLNLTSLALEGCNISSVPALNLNFPNLKFLNLKSNEISEMGEGFEQLVSLKELILDQNKIKVIDGLGRCSKLERLSIEENLVKSLEGVRYLPKLEYLSVCMNRLSDLNELENIALCGTWIATSSMNSQNQTAARPATPGTTSNSSSSSSARLSWGTQQQPQVQPNGTCRVEELNVLSNPSIRKLGTPAYRILCLRMIPSLMIIDGQDITQDEYDRAFPPNYDQQQQQLVSSSPTSPVPMTSQQIMYTSNTNNNIAQQPQQQSSSSNNSNIQPMTTFKMMEPASGGFKFNTVAPSSSSANTNNNNSKNTGVTRTSSSTNYALSGTKQVSSSSVTRQQQQQPIITTTSTSISTAGGRQQQQQQPYSSSSTTNSAQTTPNSKNTGGGGGNGTPSGRSSSSYYMSSSNTKDLVNPPPSLSKAGRRF